MHGLMTRLVSFNSVVIIYVVVMSNFSNSDFDDMFKSSLLRTLSSKFCSTIKDWKYNTDIIILLG